MSEKPIPEGAVAVIESQQYNRHDWEIAVVIGEDYKGGELYLDLRGIRAFRLRTIWDEKED